MPEGDVLVHAGDWCKDYGDLEEMKAFADWIAEQPYGAKVVIAGNHDFPAYTTHAECQAIFEQHGIHYLRDSWVEIQGVKFWGSPWQPEFCGMAFNLPRGDRLWDKWRLIPKDVDVLVTHGPPYGILDDTTPPDAILIGEATNDPHVGCKQLLRRIKQVKPKLHCFGHIHVSRGQEEVDGTTFINACNGGRHMSMGSKPSLELVETTGFRRDPMVFDLEVP